MSSSAGRFGYVDAMNNSITCGDCAAQALARLRLATTVTHEDVDEAIRLVRKTCYYQLVSVCMYGCMCVSVYDNS